MVEAVSLQYLSDENFSMRYGVMLPWMLTDGEHNILQYLLRDDGGVEGDHYQFLC